MIETIANNFNLKASLKCIPVLTVQVRSGQKNCRTENGANFLGHPVYRKVTCN